MNKFYAVGLAAAFTSASTFAILAGSIHQAPAGAQTLFGAGPVLALADKDDHAKPAKVKADKDAKIKAHIPVAVPMAPKNKRGYSDVAHGCANPAENMRGWCKNATNPRYYLECKRYASGGDFDRDDHCKYKKIGKPHGFFKGFGTVNGTVVSTGANIAQIRLDDGRLIAVNENGTVLNVGQRYSLNGCYQGNVFVLGCYSRGNYPGGSNQQLSGSILSISGNSVTLLGIPPVTINVQGAVSANRTNGPLVIGRHITAYGYYRGGTFYATTIQ